MFCFCAFLQICFPPPSEPCGTFRGLRSQGEGLFPFPVLKVSTSMARNCERRSPRSSQQLLSTPRKKRQESGRGKEHSKREQPQHFYILDEIMFFFLLGLKIAKSDKKEDGIWDFRAGFYFIFFKKKRKDEGSSARRVLIIDSALPCQALGVD